MSSLVANRPDLWRKTSRLIAAGVNWWIAELADMRPQWLSRRMTTRNSISLSLDAGRLVASVPYQKPGSFISLLFTGWNAQLEEALHPHIRDLNRYNHIQLLWPGERLLTRDITLPRQALSHLKEVIDLQIERLMPLRRESIGFAFAPHPGQRDAEKASVTLAICRREEADAALACLHKAGVRPGTVEIAADINGVVVSFLGIGANGQGPRVSRRNLTLLALPVTLSLLSLGLLAARMDHQQHRLEERINQIKPRAEEAIRLRGELREEALAREAMGTATKSPDVAPVLEELSRLIPNTAWVMEFRMEGRHGRITGLADDGASLVPGLQESALFETVRLDSSSQTRAPDGKQRFDLSFELAGDMR